MIKKLIDMNTIHDCINCRVYIIQNRNVFNVLSEKYKESNILMRQYINYSLATDAKRAKL